MRRRHASGVDGAVGRGSVAPRSDLQSAGELEAEPVALGEPVDVVRIAETVAV